MQIIEYSEQEVQFEGTFFSAKGRKGNAPCVLVGHAWDGPNQHIFEIASDLSLRGVNAFCIDVYGRDVRGKVDGDNSNLMNPLLNDRSLLQRRLKKAFDMACGIDGVDQQNIYALGFCFGGLCVLDLARMNPVGLKKVIAVHSLLSPPLDTKTSNKIDAEILLLHGWEDPVAKPEDLVLFCNEMTAKGALWSAQVFGNTKHAFTFKGANLPERGVQYNEWSSKKAWSAIYECFDLAED